jgi:hypothetical protein
MVTQLHHLRTLTARSTAPALNALALLPVDCRHHHHHVPLCRRESSGSAGYDRAQHALAQRHPPQTRRRLLSAAGEHAEDVAALRRHRDSQREAATLSHEGKREERAALRFSSTQVAGGALSRQLEHEPQPGR